MGEACDRQSALPGAGRPVCIPTYARKRPQNPKSMTTPSSPLPELPAIGFLTDVSAEHRAFLASFGKFARPQTGEHFIDEGTRQESLSLILAGSLHVISSAGDRQMLLAKLAAGDSIGEINLFDPAKASATVVARSECLIWSVSRGELEGLFEADAAAGISVMSGLMRQLSQRIRQMNDKLATAEQRAALHESFRKGDP